MHTDEHAPLKDAPVRICPSCMTPVDGDPVFCPRCNLPLGMTAGLDPINNIWARGYLYREMVHGRPSLLVLAGVWLLVVPWIAATLYGAALAVLDRNFTPLPIAALLVAVLGWILYKATRNCLRKLEQYEDEYEVGHDPGPDA